MEILGKLIRVGAIRTAKSGKPMRDIVIEEVAMYPQSVHAKLYGDLAEMELQLNSIVRAQLNLKALSNNRDGMEYWTNLVDCWKIEKL